SGGQQSFRFFARDKAHGNGVIGGDLAIDRLLQGLDFLRRQLGEADLDIRGQSAEVKGKRRRAKIPDEDRRKEMLARVLLHVIEAANAIDRSEHRLPRGPFWREAIEGMPDDPVLVLLHIYDRDSRGAGSTQRAPVGGLTAAFGVKGRAIERHLGE